MQLFEGEILDATSLSPHAHIIMQNWAFGKEALWNEAAGPISGIRLRGQAAGSIPELGEESRLKAG
jgi:hypothetical protein